MRSEVKGDFCRIEVNLNAQKPLRRGIFIKGASNDKLWLPFKFENLSRFYFGCSRMGHGLSECSKVLVKIRDLPEDDLPYSVALKAKSKVMGKVNLKLGSNMKKSMKQCFYVGDDEEIACA